LGKKLTQPVVAHCTTRSQYLIAQRNKINRQLTS
jgi:hypothetical protein